MATTIAPSAQPDASVESATMRKICWRMLPFLMLCYLLAMIDRSNVGMASLQMNTDLGLSSTVFAFGASMFFVAYFIFEVPSNLLLQRFGARRWIARIMITWGLVSAGMSLVRGETSFYVMRFILGAAEAGFFPGVVLYLTYWLPAHYRGRILALFAVAIPMSNFVGSPISGLLLGLDGLLGLKGWQWLFILEGLPTVVLGVVCLFFLTDRPEHAKWLTSEQKAWLIGRLADRKMDAARVHGSSWNLLRSPVFWCMVIACAGASSAGTLLNVWQPQVLKSFGLTDLQTGLVNALPYGIAATVMVLWGRHSDKRGERRWHTAIALLLIPLGVGGALLVDGLLPTLVFLNLILIGAYSFKGPFWSAASGWLSPTTAAAGIAGVNAISNLVGGGIMVNLFGAILDRTGSYVLALSPLAGLTLVSAIAFLIVGGGGAGAGRKAVSGAPLAVQ